LFLSVSLSSCFTVLQRRGEDVLGYNFFKWCYEEGANERDAIIVRQRQKIAYMENSLSIWKKQMQLSLVVIGVLIVINVVVLMGCNCHWLAWIITWMKEWYSFFYNYMFLAVITCSQLFKVVCYVLCNFNEMKNGQFENEEAKPSIEFSIYYLTFWYQSIQISKTFKATSK